MAFVSLRSEKKSHFDIKTCIALARMKCNTAVWIISRHYEVKIRDYTQGKINSKIIDNWVVYESYERAKPRMVIR